MKSARDFPKKKYLFACNLVLLSLVYNYMRKVTEQIKQAFERGEAKTVGNTRTDGNTVWLHGNAIV